VAVDAAPRVRAAIAKVAGCPLLEGRIERKLDRGFGAVRVPQHDLRVRDLVTGVLVSPAASGVVSNTSCALPMRYELLSSGPGVVFARWHTLQLTPWPSTIFPSDAALGSNPDPSGGVALPFTKPTGEWQRKQNVPTPGASWLAIVRAALKTGSRHAFAIMVPDHVSVGM
jgi:hypothetical protein